jgi:UDPglucose 6-dehydrogenase
MSMKVSMIGLGKLGRPCATEMARKHQVRGYDIQFIPTEFPQTASIADCIKDSEFIFVAVPTPHDPAYGGDTPTSHLPVKDFDYSCVIDVLKEIKQHKKTHQQVVLISTVLPGTCRRLLTQIIPDLIYNPYLIAVGTVAADFLDPEMVIIGHDNNYYNVDKLKYFYDTIIGRPVRYETGSWEDAESIKIFYNTFISMKIGFANMILDVAQHTGHMDVDLITQALSKCTHRIMSSKYMQPGLGDGGACHPRDNIALRWLSDTYDLGYDLFGDIMRIREIQAQRLAQTLCSHGLPVVIMGKSYKPDVPNTDGSYALLVGHYVRQLAGEVYYIDPLNHTDHECNDACVFLITYHHDWVKAYDRYPQGSIIVDPWRTNMQVPDCKVVNLGKV